MRRFLSVLITCLLVTTGPATAAKKVAKPKKLSAASEAALRKRVIEFQTASQEEFMKDKPDIERLVTFAIPSFKATYRRLYQEEADTRYRLRETQLAPVDFKRIISITPKGSRVLVDFCFVTSLRSILPEVTIPEDRSNIRLVIRRYVDEWQQIGRVWKVGSSTQKAKLEKESECTDAN